MTQSINIRCLLLFLIFLFPSFFIQADSEQDKAPIFKELNPKSRVIALFDPSRKYKVLEYRPDFLINTPASIARSSGINYYRDCYFVSQNGKCGWIIDGITAKDNLLFSDFKINKNLLPLLILTIILFLITSGVVIIRYLKVREMGLFLCSNKNTVLLIATLLLLRCIFVLTVLFQAGEFIISADVPGYFNTGLAILKTFDFSQCRYTVGHSLFLGLFSFIMGANEWYIAALPFSFFNTLLIGSLTGFFIYYLSYLLLDSKKGALISLLIYIFYPFIIQTNHTGGIYSRDFIFTPSVFEYSISLYYWTAFVGYNALSDAVNMFYVLGLFIITLKFYPLIHPHIVNKYYYYSLLIIGLLFGFSGCIRPSNICFLPCITFLIFRCYFAEARKKQYIQLLWALLIFPLGVFLGFLPQLIANYLQDGDVFTLPYHLFHPEDVQKGFQLSFLHKGGAMLFNGTSILIGLSVCGMFWVPSKIRIFIILYIFPLMIFYSGFCASLSVVRFLLPLFPIWIILTQEAVRKSFYAVLLSLIFFYILKTHYRVSSFAELKYILTIVGCFLFLAMIGFFFLKKSRFFIPYKRGILDLGIILFMQIAIISSFFSGLSYSFMIYFALCLVSLFFCSKAYNVLKTD